MTPKQIRDAANGPWDSPGGCSCGPDGHGTSLACSAYNVLADCDHKGHWKNYPANICGPRPYEILDVPHGIRCKRCGADIPKSEVLAAWIVDED